MSFSQHVDSEQMQRCLEETRAALADMDAGFDLLTNLTDLEVMEPACALFIESIMTHCQEREIGAAVRVIPDPAKDIGFTIMSRFHYGSNVKFRTYDNLPDALDSLRPTSMADAAP